MGKHVSPERREDILRVRDKTDMTTQEVADLFGVAVASIYRWSAKKKATGSCEPEPRGGGKRPAFDAALLDEFKELGLAHNDATENELMDMWNVDHVPVSRSVIHRALVRLGLTRKKKRTPRTKPTPRG